MKAIPWDLLIGGGIGALIAALALLNLAARIQRRVTRS